MQQVISLFKNSRLGGYFMASLVGAVVASVSLSACVKVKLLNPDSNATDVGIPETTSEPVAVSTPQPIAGTAILTGGGISTGTGPSGTVVMKVVSTVGESLVSASTGPNPIQVNAHMQVIPGLQGTIYQAQ